MTHTMLNFPKSVVATEKEFSLWDGGHRYLDAERGEDALSASHLITIGRWPNRVSAYDLFLLSSWANGWTTDKPLPVKS